MALYALTKKHNTYWSPGRYGHPRADVVALEGSILGVQHIKDFDLIHTVAILENSTHISNNLLICTVRRFGAVLVRGFGVDRGDPKRGGFWDRARKQTDTVSNLVGKDGGFYSSLLQGALNEARDRRRDMLEQAVTDRVSFGELLCHPKL